MKRVLTVIIIAIFSIVMGLSVACGEDAGNGIYTVTIDLGYETEGREYEIEVGIEEAINEPTVEREGYTLKGWFIDGDESKPINFLTFVADRDIKIVAIWEQKMNFGKVPKNFRYEVSDNKIKLTAEGDEVLFAQGTGEFSTNGEFEYEPATYYIFKAKEQGYDGIVEIKFTTAPSESNFEISPTEGKLDYLTITQKDQKEYEYSMDEKTWIATNEIKITSRANETVQVYARVKGTVSAPAGMSLAITTEIPYSYEKDFDSIVKSTDNQGYTVSYFTNTDSSKFKGQTTYDGKTNKCSLKLQFTKGVSVQDGGNYVNTYYNIPSEYKGMILDVKIESEQEESVKLVGLEGATQGIVKSDGNWNTIVTNGNLIQFRNDETTTVYIDNIRFYTNAEYKNVIDKIKADWGNIDTSGATVTANTLYLDDDNNLSPKIEAYNIKEGKLLTQNILFTKLPTDDYVEITVKYVRRDGETGACVKMGTIYGEKFNNDEEIPIDEWITVRIKTFFDGVKIHDTKALLQINTTEDVTIYIKGIKTQGEKSLEYDTDTEWIWN